MVKPEKRLLNWLLIFVNVYKTKPLVINIVNIVKQMICIEFLGTLEDSRVSEFELRGSHCEMTLVSVNLEECSVVIPSWIILKRDPFINF
jgi:hypothetical protein